MYYWFKCEWQFPIHVSHALLQTLDDTGRQKSIKLMDNLLFASDDDMPVKGGDYSDDDNDTLNANRVTETTLTTLNSTDEQLTSTTGPKKKN